MQKLPRLLHFLVNLIGLNLLLLFLLRLAFWVYFDNPNDPIPFDVLLDSFYLGFKYDLRLTLIMVLPLFILGGIRFLSPFESRFMHRLWLGLLGLVFGIIVLMYFMNFGYFAYLQQPMNATVLRFAYNFSTSMQMLQESYPMFWIMSGWLALVAGYYWLLSHLLARAERYTNPHFHGWKKAGMITISIVLVLFGLYGKFSWYPLRWSEAFTHPHPFAPAVAMNPVLYFLNTLKNKDSTFDEKATRQYYSLMADFLGVDKPDSKTLNYRRDITRPGPLAASRPNIIMVFLESFAAYKTGSFGNPLNPTPHFDELARNGLLFTRYYTPHTGTARSVFAAITGIPDVEPAKTASRNPLVVDQHTIINAFKGYNKLYFLGGSANWGNIRGVLQRNIPGLDVHEEGDYEAERVDVWGISDLSLFEEALKVLDKRHDKPFFAIIQTSGNHRPYTIPEDNRAFQLQHHDHDTLQKAGFISEGEYNSFRFMDHSLGLFMGEARQRDYFDNTIFVFYGDHGITGYAGKHSPEYITKYQISGFHTPLVIYAPGLIPEAKTYDKVGSEVDLLPTIAGLAAPGYVNTTLGRDLRDPRFDDRRYAFTITHQTIPEIGLIGPDHYFRMLANGDNKVLAAIHSNRPVVNVLNQQPEVAKRMETLTRAIYETARYMLFHNKARAGMTDRSPATDHAPPQGKIVLPHIRLVDGASD